MKIKFFLRTLGQHQIFETELDCIPREGEWVSIDGGNIVRYVHSVGYDVPTKSAHVLLRD